MNSVRPWKWIPSDLGSEFRQALDTDSVRPEKWTRTGFRHECLANELRHLTWTPPDLGNGYRQTFEISSLSTRLWNKIRQACFGNEFRQTLEMNSIRPWIWIPSGTWSGSCQALQMCSQRETDGYFDSFLLFVTTCITCTAVNRVGGYLLHATPCFFSYALPVTLCHILLWCHVHRRLVDLSIGTRFCDEMYYTS